MDMLAMVSPPFSSQEEELNTAFVFSTLIVVLSIYEKQT